MDIAKASSFIDRLARWGSVPTILCLFAITWIYFQPLLACWVLALTTATYVSPTLGTSLLFLVISIDLGNPVAGGIIVSFSEIEFAACLMGFVLSRGLNKNQDWRPLLWAIPFLIAVSLSGLANIDLIKVPFHVLRLSELIVAMYLASSAFREAQQSSTAGKLGQRALSLSSIITPEISFRISVGLAATFYSCVGLSQLTSARLGRVFSFFTNPNQFAGYLLMLIPFCLVFLLSAQNRRTRLLWGYLFLLVLLGMTATMSLGGMIASLAAMSLLLAMYCWKRAPILRRSADPLSITSLRRFAVLILVHLLITAVSLTFLISHTELLDRLAKPVDTLKSRFDHPIERYEKTRLQYLRIGWTIWKDHPVLGVGPGAYAERLKDYWALVENLKTTTREISDDQRISGFDALPIHLHNLYLQLAVSFGLSGLLAFTFFLWKTLKSLLLDSSRSITALAGSALLAGFLIHNLFDVTFPSLGLEMGILLGFALREPSARKSTKSRSTLSTRVP